jgi:radical SAM protein (TIGR01212 family)
MTSPYLQYKDYLTERYGAPLFRVPIDFNFGCPHREADGTGGCTFCNVRGSRAVQTLGQDSVQDQMQEAIRFARERYGAEKFMAYIQAFSATFGKAQQAMYLELLHAFDFSAISFGTRPDDLTPQAYEFLSELNRDTEVWVELGVQTVHERTLKRINRGHGWAVCEKAIRRLHELGIKVTVHVILGLPGETSQHYRQTAGTLAALPIDAVKIHNLHIEKGTTLAAEYALMIHRESTQGTQKQPPSDFSRSLRSVAVTHEINPFMEYEFAEHLMDFIRRLPPGIPILRLTADTPDDELIAPRWHMAKGQFRDYVLQQMTCREWRQGDLFERGETRERGGRSHLKSVKTEDGSITLWNDEYREHYHTPAGARLEAMEKYIVPGKLKERLAKGPVKLLDVCFGLGYNSLTAMNCAIEGTTSPLSAADAEDSVPPALSITALEMDRRAVFSAAQHIQSLPNDSFQWNECLSSLYESQACNRHPGTSISIAWGDARYTATLQPEASFDLIFLDAFSTQRNSELWTVDFFRTLRRLMKPDAVLITYCAALPVRAGLLEAGFSVGETEPVGRRRSGTIAAMRAEDIDSPLPAHEITTIRETTRGLPYQDPHGVRTNREILRDRQERILQRKQEASLNP